MKAAGFMFTLVLSETGVSLEDMDVLVRVVNGSKCSHDVEKFGEEHKDQDDRDAYKSMVQSLPVLVRTAGLAQALAFVNARPDKRKAQKAILDHLNELLANDLDGQSLTQRSRAAPLSEYMYLTRQVMSALLWYKRYAEWLLDKDSAPPSTAVYAAAGAIIPGGTP